IHAAHTREIDRLGGLAKVMPRTSLCFLVGAVAICGLPPLNGFVSEYLIYVGFFHAVARSGGDTWIAGAFGAPMGALIAACTVLGLAPLLVAPLLDTAAGAWAPEIASRLAPLAAMTSLGWIG